MIKSFLWKCFCKCFFMLEEFKYYVEMRSHNKKFKPTKPKKMGKKLFILGTGPSCTDYLNNRDLFEDYDILCVNSFMSRNNKEFCEIQPKYMCLADPIFIDEENEETKEVMGAINQISWNCYLISPANYVFKTIDNPHIKHIKMSSFLYENENKRRDDWYCKNLATPSIVNVVNLALFFGVTFGYEEIGLIGVESSFHKGLKVDKQNRKFIIEEHLYHEPYWAEFQDELWLRYLFWSKNIHTDFIFAQIAQKTGCKITNYTIDSFIDVFKKQELSELRNNEG